MEDELTYRVFVYKREHITLYVEFENFYIKFLDYLHFISTKDL